MLDSEQRKIVKSRDQSPTTDLNGFMKRNGKDWLKTAARRCNMATMSTNIVVMLVTRGQQRQPE